MAKGVTSGYLPLGAVAVAEPVWAPFWDEDDPQMFHHGITYSGHASACAAAMANLDILEREQLPQRARSLEGPLADALRRCAANPLVSEVRAGVGLLAAVEFHDPAHAAAAAERCLDAGVILRVIANGALQVSPPLMIDEADIALLGRGSRLRDRSARLISPMATDSAANADRRRRAPPAADRRRVA